MRQSVRRLLQFGLASLAILAVAIVVFILMRPAASPPAPALELFARGVVDCVLVFILLGGLGIAFAVVAAGAVWLVVQLAFLVQRRRNARKAEWFLAPANAVLAAYVAFLVLLSISVHENVRGIRRIEETCRREKVETTDDLLRLFGKPDLTITSEDGAIWLYYACPWPRTPLLHEAFRFRVDGDGRVTAEGVRGS